MWIQKEAFKNSAEKEVERQKERKREAKELEALPKRAEGTPDDPVRMYLRQMGQISLLSREDEIALAKKIESGELDFRDAIFECLAAKTAVLDMMDKILHWLNPINDNQNIYIYRNKALIPDKVDR